MAFLAPKTDSINDAQSPMAHEIEGPLPVVLGRARIPLRLIETPFNHTVVDHGDKRPKGNVYSLVMAGCWGPVKRLHEIYVNGKPLYLSGWASGDYTDMQHGSWAGPPNNTGASKLRVYWGTDNQAADPFLNGTAVHGRPGARNWDGTARSHPPYAGVFYVIFYNLHLDDGGSSIAGTANIPTIEAEVSVEAGSSGINYEFGTNPIGSLYEILTNRIWGAGLPESIIPAAAWAAKAAAIASGYSNASGTEGYLSPVLLTTADLEKTLAELLSYYDGFVELRNGQLLPGWFPNQPGSLPAVITEISRHDMVEEPDMDPGGWEDTINEVSVKSLNVFERLNDETITERNAYNLRVTERESRKTVDAQYIINPIAQRKMAARTLAHYSEPPFSARLKLLRSRARHADGSLILPGDIIRLDYQPYAMDLLCRVIERDDKQGDVELKVQSEPGRFPETYVMAADPRDRPDIGDADPITHWQLFELPAALSDAWPPVVAILAVRPNDSIVGAQGWISSTGDFAGEESVLPSVGSFAAAVTVASISQDGIGFQLATTSDIVLDRSFGADEQRNGEMLILIGNELISLGTRDALNTAPPYYAYAAARGMWGTPVEEHDLTEPVSALIFSRATLEVAGFSHESLRWEMPYSAAAATVFVRLRTFTGWETGSANTAQSIILRERLEQDSALPQFTVFAWARSASDPGTPTGGTYASPAPTSVGWFLNQPEGSNPLWMSRRTYYSDQDPTAWSAPVRVTGTDGLPGESPRVYSIIPSAQVIVFDDPNFDPTSITATGYVTVGNVRTEVAPAEAVISAHAYRSAAWNAITLPYTMQASDERIRVRLESASNSDILAEILLPVITAGQSGPPGEPGETGSSTLMAFGRFLEQPAAPAGTGAPPDANWSLDSEAAPGNSIYPLWVTVGTRPQGGLQWTWQLPFRFTPEKGDPGDPGTPGVSGISTAHLTVYRRSSVALTTAPTGGSYNFDTLTLTEPLNWFASIPTGTDPLYASNSLAAVPGDSGVDNALTWTTPRFIAAKGDTGTPGTPGTPGEPGVSSATLTIYTRTPSPGTPANNLFGYTFATDTLADNATNYDEWSREIPAGTGDLWASTAFVSTLYPQIEILPITWSAPRKVAENGQPGISTAQVFAYKRSTNGNLLETPSGGSYNFDTKTLTPPTWPTGYSATIPSDATAGFAYVVTATAATIGQSGIDSDLIWTQSRRLTDDMLLPDGSIDASKIADNAVIASKIAANAITAVKIAAGAITTEKLDALAITADKIAANAITAAKIAALAITAEKIAANAITADKIAAGAITAAKIDVANLAALSTNTGHLTVDGSATSGTYAPGSSGWKIESNGSAEFNQLTLRAGIINPGHILLHDPSVLAYNPHFETVENGVPAGWNVYTETGTNIVHGTFGPAAGKGLRFDRTGSGTYAQVGNQLIVPVLAGERLVARALVREGTWTLIITTLNGNKIWTQDDPYVWRTVGADWGYVESVFTIPDDVRYINITVRQSWGVGETQSGYLAGVSLMRQAAVLDEVTAAPVLIPSQSFSTSLPITRPLVPSGRKLLYTTDGSEVTRNSPEWLSGVSLSVAVDTTLRARFVSIMSGSIGPETMASYTKAATPPAAPLPRPTASLTENRIATFVSALYGGAGTTTLHYSISSGASNSEASDYWSLSPAIVLGSGDFMTVWATGANGARSPDLIITHNPAYDGRYQL